MGYFSNGTEGDDYEAKYCSRCVHGDNHRGKNDGCPVIVSHVLYAYQLCNEEKHPGKHMLDLLIPREGAFNGECRMFVDAKALGLQSRSESLRPAPSRVIPDIPRKWMWELCADETRSSISTPFRQRVMGRSWDIATNGRAMLLLEASGDIEERADAPQLDGLVASWAKPTVTQRVAFEQLWSWLNVKDKLRKCSDCNGQGCEDCDGKGKYPVAVPGKLAGLVVNRVLFRDRLRHVRHDGDVTVTAPADRTTAPVCIDGGSWRLYVMSMVPDLTDRAPVFRVQGLVTPAPNAMEGKR